MPGFGVESWTARTSGLSLPGGSAADVGLLGQHR